MTRVRDEVTDVRSRRQFSRVCGGGVQRDDESAGLEHWNDLMSRFAKDAVGQGEDDNIGDRQDLLARGCSSTT